MTEFGFYYEGQNTIYGIVKADRILYFKSEGEGLKKGTVVRVDSYRRLKGLDAYEVSLLDGEKGFLPFKDAGPNKDQKILEVVHEATASKLPRLSEKTELARKYEAEVNFTPSPKLLFVDKFWEFREALERFEVGNIKTNSEDLKNEFKGDFDILFDKSYQPEYDYELSEFFKTRGKREIFLKDGINFVVDRLEALTVVDINSGGFFLDSKFRTGRYVNEICVKDIINAVVINEIKGIIIIDAIRTDKKSLIQLIDIYKEELDIRKMAYDISYTKNKLIEVLIKRN